MAFLSRVGRRHRGSPLADWLWPGWHRRGPGCRHRRQPAARTTASSTARRQRQHAPSRTAASTTGHGGRAGIHGIGRRLPNAFVRIQ